MPTLTLPMSLFLDLRTKETPTTGWQKNRATEPVLPTNFFNSTPNLICSKMQQELLTSVLLLAPGLKRTWIIYQDDVIYPGIGMKPIMEMHIHRFRVFASNTYTLNNNQLASSISISITRLQQSL